MQVSFVWKMILSKMKTNDVAASNNPELMDSNNPEPNQGTEPTIDTSEWRAQLIPGSRVKFVNKILDMLKNHASVSGHEPNSVQLLRLQCIVLRFEEKVFTTAGSKSDYLRKISMKMLIICEQISKHQANNMPANEVGPNN